jgi:hypothetical protein
MGNLVVGIEILGYSLVIRDTNSMSVVRKFNYSWTFHFIFYGYNLKNIHKRIVIRARVQASVFPTGPKGHCD